MVFKMYFAKFQIKGLRVRRGINGKFYVPQDKLYLQ